MEEATHQLEQVVPSYAAEHVTLAVENHGLHTTKQLTSLFDRLNSPYFGCCLDTVNSFGALEDPQRVIDALTPYIVNLHIKDFDIRRVDHQMGFVVLGTPAGDGRLDLDYVLAGLNRCGKKPTAILELWTPYAGSVPETVRIERQWLDESLRYIRKYPFH